MCHKRSIRLLVDLLKRNHTWNYSKTQRWSTTALWNHWLEPWWAPLVAQHWSQTLVKHDCWTACTISLSQKAYINSILKEFNFEDTIPLSISAKPGAVLGKHKSPKTTQEFKDMENISYAWGVRKIMYYYVAVDIGVFQQSSTPSRTTYICIHCGMDEQIKWPNFITVLLC